MDEGLFACGELLGDGVALIPYRSIGRVCGECLGTV